MRLFLGLCTAVLFSLAPHPACGEKKANAHYTGQEIQRSFEIMTKRCGEQSDTESPGCRVLHHILAYVRYGDMFILGNDPVDVFTGEYIKDHGRGSEYLMLPEDEKQRAAAALYHVALLHVLQRLEQTRDTYSLETASELHKAVGATRPYSAAVPDDPYLGLLDEPSDGSMWRFGSGFSVA
ncbi:MAG: hypothetical protein U1C18_01465, partial [Patescibacteria group bacterium]|nr:hypothetical protein [Patescibacteria group bacterium]